MNDPDDITNTGNPSHASEDDIELTWQAIEEANTGGSFAPNADALNWLRSLGMASELSASQATIQF